MLVHFLSRDGIDVDSDRKEGDGTPQGVGGGEIIIKIYCMKNYVFHKRSKIEKRYMRMQRNNE